MTGSKVELLLWNLNGNAKALDLALKYLATRVGIDSAVGCFQEAPDSSWAAARRRGSAAGRLGALEALRRRQVVVVDPYVAGGDNLAGQRRFFEVVDEGAGPALVPCFCSAVLLLEHAALDERRSPLRVRAPPEALEAPAARRKLRRRAAPPRHDAHHRGSSPASGVAPSSPSPRRSSRPRVARGTASARASTRGGPTGWTGPPRAAARRRPAGRQPQPGSHRSALPAGPPCPRNAMHPR